MNRSTLRNLGIVLFALVAILIGLELNERGTGTTATGQPLFDDLRARINDIRELEVEAPGSEPVVIRSGEEGWVVGNRNDYPANVAKVREVLLALADARVLEQKTSNPERYEALGVRDPDVEGASGTRLTASGGGESFAVIIGNTAQGSNRYVRVAGEATSLLIDTNPVLPDDIGGWLDSELIDVDTATVREVAIEHADGETIRIAKDRQEDADFAVADLPDGRELSYPTAANSIGGALNDLGLEDVRPAGAAGAATTTTVETFDGLRVTVSVFDDDDEATWIAIDAAAAEAAPVPDEETPDDEAAAEDGADDTETEAEAEVTPEQRAAQINARVAGREFRIPQYKATQLTRRWDDILAAVDADDE